MEEIMKESEKILGKIMLMESFISLHLRREQIEPHIQELSEKTKDVTTLIQRCNQAMKTEYATAMKEYEDVMRKMQENQLLIMDILLEKKRTATCTNVGANKRLEAASKTPNTILKERQPKSIEKSRSIATSIHKLSTGENKMYLGEYLQSPFVRKTRPVPVPFQFLDFEVSISQEMFESIPKYMRGRETLEELTNFLDTVLVPCFNEKYQLLHRHRDCIRNHADLDIWKIYKDQVSYFPGQNFITQGDISRKIKKMLDKKSQNKITMLRHLGILQEQRKAQTVCYIWTASNV